MRKSTAAALVGGLVLGGTLFVDGTLKSLVINRVPPNLTTHIWRFSRGRHD